MEKGKEDKASEVSSHHHDAKRQKLDKEKSRHLSDFHRALDMMGMDTINFQLIIERKGEATPLVLCQMSILCPLPRNISKFSVALCRSVNDISQKVEDSKTTFDSQLGDISQEKFIDEDTEFSNVAGTNADDQEDSIAGDEFDGQAGASHQGSSDAAEEERLKMQLLVSKFSKDQLSRYEMYRRSTFPKAAIRKIVQQSAGCAVSPNVIIAISGIAKVFTGEIMEEVFLWTSSIKEAKVNLSRIYTSYSALDIRDRMKDGKDAVKPKHIREALRRLTAKGGLSSTIITKRKAYYSLW
uniref:TAFII28-like protein domain-containing protein n=1 Tax=Romanomermis culicivorax TaxID=13658 RepID=A0A915KR74_ROMCU